MPAKGYRKTKGRSIEELEKLKFRTLDLYNNPTTLNENVNGIELNWYGKRLTILRQLYNKSCSEIAVYLDTRLLTVSEWERNRSKPCEKEIERLCFLFEVPDNFFTNETINLKIKQQLKISL